MEEVNIPSAVETIGACAFSGQDLLTTVYLSSAVKTVEEYAFSGTTALREVYYSGNEASREKIVIEKGDDTFINATWKYLKAVTGVSLDKSSEIYTRMILLQTRQTHSQLQFFLQMHHILK